MGFANPLRECTPCCVKAYDRIVKRMIVLFSDFGLGGPYTGQVNAVLQQAAPGVPVIQLFADAPAVQVKPAAYLLAGYAAWFPVGTVFLCVVDPGVGGVRRGLIVEADGRIYVGPDNGLFELVWRRAAQRQCGQIDWRPPALSASFHGRDLFAPVAARLALGEPRSAFGSSSKPLPFGDWPDDLAEIVYIDHYGNAITGLRGECLATTAQFLAGGWTIAHAETFSAVNAGRAFWYVNSNGLIEIAINAGRADRVVGLAVGSDLQILAG